MNVYDFVKDLCKQNNTNIASVERAAGLSNGTIGGWRSSSPSAASIVKLSEYFHLPVDYILSCGQSSEPVIAEAIARRSTADSSPVRLALYAALIDCTEEECQSVLNLLNTFRRDT